jgi:hypothetical protein
LCIACLHYWSRTVEAFVIFHADDKMVPAAIPLPAGRWEKELNSRDASWGDREQHSLQFRILRRRPDGGFPYSLLLLLINRI